MSDRGATPGLAALIERYRRLESALIYDCLDSMGLPHQQLSLEIQPLDPDMVVAGEAFTSKATVSEAGARVDTERLRLDPARYRMLDELYAGCVLVEDVGNDPVSGGLGENMGLSVRVKGCVGVVCDGGTRDKKALIRAGFPVFSRFSSATFSRDRRRHLDYQIPLRISGHLTRWVTVNPGDFVFGDSDGVLVIPRPLALEVLEAAEKVQEIEEEQRRRLAAGEPREEVYRVDRYAHCRRLSGDEIVRYTGVARP
jgi:4-hydroxy-4-methyl-2-oxoglutarate aldolase